MLVFQFVTISLKKKKNLCARLAELTIMKMISGAKVKYIF